MRYHAVLTLRLPQWYYMPPSFAASDLLGLGLQPDNVIKDHALEDLLPNSCNQHRLALNLAYRMPPGSGL